VHEAVGGWSHLFRVYLEHQLLSPGGLAVGGVPLTIDGQPVLIFASLHNVLGDGEGLMKAFDWKGASSMKPCVKHYNVLRKACCPKADRFAMRPSRSTFAAVHCRQ
jgi:hypothetical protein